MNNHGRKAWAAREGVVSSPALFARTLTARNAGLACAMVLIAACKPAAEAPLGPSPSFMLLQAEGAADGLPLVTPVKGTDGAAANVTAALNDGFAAELLRTVYVTQQYIQNAPGSQPASARALAWAKDATPFVLNAPQPTGRGVALRGPWLGGPLLRPQTNYIGVPLNKEPRQLVPELARYIGSYLGSAAATAGAFDAETSPLASAYAKAMEVIAREWKGTAGGGMRPQLSEVDGNLFAGVRENRFVLDAQGKLRPPLDLLGDEGVAATVFYRWFQDKQLMKTVADDAFYAPLKSDRIPPGVSPAVVLGTFRNLQMKVLGCWIDAVRAGHGPKNIADLVRLYGQRFPAERAAVIRLFVATTYGATVKPPGLSPKPEDATTTLAALTALSDDVISGKTPLLSLP